MSVKVQKTIPVFSIDSHAALTKHLPELEHIGSQGMSARVVMSGDPELIVKAVADLAKLKQLNIVSGGVSLRGDSRM